MKQKMVMLSGLLSGLISCMSLSAVAGPEPVKPFPPFRIADNLYYVGDNFAASYLITSTKGNILVNTGYPDNLQLIKDSIAKLGQKYDDIKIILISHAHNDHAGASAQVKQETGAKYMVMEGDVSVVESGGKDDFIYNTKDDLYPATQVDTVLHDGDKVKLGDAELVAHLTAGHTKGSTTWTMRVKDHGKSYDAIFTGSTSVNPGYKLVNNAAYPTIAEDYQQMFKVLKALPCDIFLGSHGGFFDLDKKYALLNSAKTNPFIDPVGYQNFVASKQKSFEDELEKQTKG